jgi:hypothetical protein
MTKDKPEQVSDSTWAKFQSLKLVISTHNLLTVGTFQKNYFASVDQSLTYLSGMYQVMIKELVELEDAEFIPEIKDHKNASTRNNDNQEIIEETSSNL